MYYDSEFLKKLDENRTKTTYAKIIALSIDETPLETIEGRVTQGSVNLDGDSAVRRTCSLTMVAQDYDYSSYLWGLNTKFKLEIGLENTIDSRYPNIIWFKQGTYYISSFNTSRSTNNFNITIQGKDKMCGLNGEVGGTITGSTDFGTIEEVDANGIIKIIRIPLKEIIRNVVHLYGGEPAHNILINDLDMTGLELLEYRYDENTPLYLYKEITKENSKFDNVFLGNNKKAIKTDGTGSYDSLDLIPYTELVQLINPAIGSANPATFYFDNDVTKQYKLARVNYGDTAGYRYTDLTYPGDLIGNTGEALTSILDKIKNMLGDYEYFYNLDGQFVFQKKKIYVNSSWSPVTSDSEGLTYVTDKEPVAYTFKNGELVTTFNNNPNLSNLKNDFSVWGERTGVSGAAIPVHMRYAIDKKPTQYTSIEVEHTNPDLINYNNKYGVIVSGQTSVVYDTNTYDWRELIYQMGRDYYKYAHILDDFEARLLEANPEFVTGKTGYENYYIDLISYWRDLYDITLSEMGYDQTIEDIDAKKDEILIKENLVKEKEKSLQNLKNENATEAIILLAQNELDNAKAELSQSNQDLSELEDTRERYENYYYKADDVYRFWNEAVYETPQNLNFWFDFLDSEGELSQFSIKNVGCRPKAINDSNVKAIYFRETPEVIFSSNLSEDMKQSTNYTYINIDETYENTMFSISSQGKSAKEVVDELLYKHSYCIESATINSIPIYYLEPNCRIQIVDEETKLNGYYTVSKMSIPLTYNGTMSITATRAADLNI